MKHTNKSLQKILFLIIIVLLALPFIQARFSIFEISPLKGAISTPHQKELSFSNWFSGEYQLAEEDYLNETFGFRNLFVRVNNQIAFSFFNKAKANSVIVGKEDYLFEKNYLKAYYGKDYIGFDSINGRINRLKYIQDTLAKLNKELLVVFAAGKGSFYPEYFPDEFVTNIGPTNYGEHVQLAEKTGLNFIDFNDYFIKHKNTSPYPLYPQYGIHWSYYGMCIAADSIIQYIENKRNIDMPDLYWDDIEIDQPRGTDYDIADGMNIKFRLKSFDMAYPKIKYESDSGKTKPSVLVISDSYYWGMFNFGISQVFSTSHFWFYNKKIYPDSFKSSLETSEVDLEEEINKHDVVIIMATEATLPALGWGFIENAYDLYTNPQLVQNKENTYQQKVTKKRKEILSNEKWMELVREKALKKNISIDSMVTLDAIWLIKNEEKKLQ
jgi:hypothetical protein